MAEGIKLATAYVEVTGDTKTLVKNVSSALDGVGKTAATDFGRTFVPAMAGHGKTAADKLGVGMSAGMTKHGGTAAQNFMQGLTSGLGGGRASSAMSGMFSGAGAIGKAGGAALGAGIVVGVGAAVVEAGKALYGLGSTFDEIADSIAARTGALGKDLDAITASMDKVATTTASSLADIGDIGGRLVQSLHLTGPVLEQVTQQLADLNRLTGETANIRELGKLMRAFGISAGDVPAKIEELARASRATAIPVNELVDQLLGAAPAAQEFGVPFDQLVSLFGTFEEAGLNAEKVVPALSIALKQFAKDGREPVQALRDTITEIQRLTDVGDPRAIELAAKLFGRGYLPILDAIRSHKIDIDSLNASILNTGPSIRQVAEANADWAEKWRILKNEIAVALEPFSKGVFNTVNTELEKLAASLENNKPAIIGFFTGLATAVADSVEGVVRTLATLTDGVADVVGFIGGVYANILDVTASVKDVLPWGDKEEVARLRAMADAARDWDAGLQGAGKTLVDAADGLKRMRDGIQGAGDAANNAAKFVKDLGDAVVEVTDQGAILKAPTPEQLDAIDQAKYKIEAIPDSKDFKIIPRTEDAEAKLNAFREQEGQKPIQMKVEPLLGPAIDGLNKFRADVAANPLQINTALVGPGVNLPGGMPGSTTGPFGPALSATPTPAGGGNTRPTVPGGGGTGGLVGPAISGGRLPPSPASIAAIAKAQALSGLPYTSGTLDCSGYLSQVYSAMVGHNVHFTTVADFAALGFHPGYMPGALNIGVTPLPGQAGHMAGTLPNGINIESGGRSGAVTYNAATGAMDPQFSQHWWFMPGYGGGGGVFGAGRGDRIPAMLEPGEHVLTRGDVAALGGQSGVYALRQVLHMQGGGNPLRHIDPGKPDPRNKARTLGPGGDIPSGDVWDWGPEWWQKLWEGEQPGWLWKNWLPPESGIDKLVPGGRNRGGDKRWTPKPRVGSLGFQGGGAAEIPDWVTAAAQAAGITPQEYLASITLSATAGMGPAPGPVPHLGTGQVPGPVQQVTDQATQQGPQVPETADSARFPGLEPTTTGTVGIAGTSFIAKSLNLPNEFIGFLIDTGAEVAQSAISAAISAGVAGGTMGIGAAAAPIAGAAGSQAAGFGIKIAAAEAKRLTSYGFQMAAIGIDSVIENLFSPIGGAPRWMGYDYTQFIPQLAMQGAQAGVTTAEQAINTAITQGISGQGQPMGPVQPGQLPGMSQTTGPTPAFGQAPAPPSSPPAVTEHAGSGVPPGPLAGPAVAPPQPEAAPAPTPAQQNPIDLLQNLFGFDQGGWLEPNMVGVNLTRQPEPVLSREQWDHMTKLSPTARQQYGVYVENIYASDAQDVSRQIAQKQNLARMRYAGRP